MLTSAFGALSLLDL